MSNNIIPQEKIDEILAANDIVTTVSKYVRLAKSGKNYSGLCPFHSEKTPSFSVATQLQRFKCFGCGVGGNSISFVMKMTGNDFVTTCKEMAEASGVLLDIDPLTEVQDERQLQRKTVLEAYQLAANLYQHILLNTKEGLPAREYLHQRGFNREMIEQFQIGFVPNLTGDGRDVLAKVLHKRNFSLSLLTDYGLLRGGGQVDGFADKFYGRVMFPIQDERGRVIAFGARWFEQPDQSKDTVNQPKYLNSQESDLFHKSKTLYGFHLARPEIKNTQTVVIFEGYVDLIKAWSAGVSNGVATLGTALGQAHAQLLKRYANKVVLCFDSDAAGQAAIYKSIDMLHSQNLQVKVVVIPDGKDPDDYIMKHGDAAFRALLDSAVSATRFKFIYQRAKYNLQDDQEKLSYIKSCLSLLLDVRSPTERELYMKELSDEFALSLPVLKEEYQELLRRRPRSVEQYDLDSLMAIAPASKAGQTNEMLPAYQRAERFLLALMMDHSQITHYVMECLGDEFHVAEHAAIAAHLYAYYSANANASPQSFIFQLDDEHLIDVATSIMMIDDIVAATGIEQNMNIINDYIDEVKKRSFEIRLESLREEMEMADRKGDQSLVTQLVAELMRLQKQLKQLT